VAADSTTTSTTVSTATSTTTTTTPVQPGPPALVTSHPGFLAPAPGDLPQVSGGWHKLGGIVATNQIASKIEGATVSEIQSAGRTTGYFESFIEKLKRVGGHTLLGCCTDQVVALVDVFDNDADAKTVFNATRAGAGWRIVHVPAKLGDASRVSQGKITPPYPSEGQKEPAYRVSWLSGPVIVTLVVGGLLPESKDALALAATVDGRVSRALG
jgi:hypothetical protein